MEFGSFWIIDDAGLTKKDNHSVGWARQYCVSCASWTAAKLSLACRWHAKKAVCTWLGKTIRRFVAMRVRCARGNVGKACLLPQRWLLLKVPAVSKDYVPRSSPARSMPHTGLDHLAAPSHKRNARQRTGSLPSLRLNRPVPTLVRLKSGSKSMQKKCIMAECVHHQKVKQHIQKNAIVRVMGWRILR